MKAGIVSLAVVMCLGVMGLGFASSITPALADADDAAWIKKCVSDNKQAGRRHSRSRGRVVFVHEQHVHRNLLSLYKTNVFRLQRPL